VNLLAQLLAGLQRHHHQLHARTGKQDAPEITIRLGLLFDVADEAFH
jgi:hypothetical protein